MYVDEEAENLTPGREAVIRPRRQRTALTGASADDREIADIVAGLDPVHVANVQGRSSVPSSVHSEPINPRLGAAFAGALNLDTIGLGVGLGQIPFPGPGDARRRTTEHPGAARRSGSSYTSPGRPPEFLSIPHFSAAPREPAFVSRPATPAMPVPASTMRSTPDPNRMRASTTFGLSAASVAEQRAMNRAIYWQRVDEYVTYGHDNFFGGGNNFLQSVHAPRGAPDHAEYLRDVEKRAAFDRLLIAMMALLRSP